MAQRARFPIVAMAVLGLAAVGHDDASASKRGGFLLGLFVRFTFALSKLRRRPAVVGAVGVGIAFAAGGDNILRFEFDDFHFSLFVFFHASTPPFKSLDEKRLEACVPSGKAL